MSDVAGTLARIHRQVEPSMGALALTLERRRVHPTTLVAWAEVLERAAVQLRKLADDMKKESKT